MIQIFLILFSATCFGQEVQPLLVTGNYEYSFSYKTHWVHHIQNINADTEDGYKRIQELEGQGFVCRLDELRKYTKCLKKIFNVSNDDVVTRYLTNYFRDWTVSFSPPVGQPKLVFSTTFQKQWLIEQKAELSGIIYPELYYVWFQTQGQRVYFPDPHQGIDEHTPYLNIDDQGHLSRWMTVQASDGKSQFIYFVEAALARIE